MHRARPDLCRLEPRDTPAVVSGLDPSFGTAGVADIGTNGQATTGAAVLVQPDGKIVIAGTTDAANPANADFLVTRLLPTGALDPSFGAGGRAIVGFAPGSDDEATAVGLQSNGDIVVGGFSNAAGTYDMAAVRLTPAGVPDTGFGSNGFVLLDDIKSADKAYALKVLPDDRILLAGDSDGVKEFVARLTPAGAADPGFNGGKALVFAVGAGAEGTRAADLQADGSTVLAGFGNNGADLFVARVKPDGTGTDPAFGVNSNGFTKATFVDFAGGEDKAFAVKVQPDGNIVLAGYATTGTGKDFAVARVRGADGTPDPAFGTGGKAAFDLGGGGNDQANAVAVQPDGRIVLAGSAPQGGATGFALARVAADGKSLDPTFFTTGKTVIPVPSKTAQANAVALNANGQAVVVGNAGASSPPGDVVAVRLFNSPVLPAPLLVGGSADGKAVEYAPSGGQYAVPGTTYQAAAASAANVRVALADVNGDGVPDRITVAGPGAAPVLTVHSGKDDAVIASFPVFEATFTGGLFVAAADLTGDGKADVVVTPDQGGGPVVAVYDGAKLSAGQTGDAAQVVRFYGISDPTFRGGARPALGDVNGDGTPDLVVAAGFGGGPRVAIFNGKDVAAGNPNPGRLINDFYAFEPGLRNGAYVAAGDVDGDGSADLVFGGGPSGGPRVRVASGKVLLGQANLVSLDPAPAAGLQLANFYAGDPAARGGVPVAVRDVDGTGKAAVVAASGQGQASRVLVYKSANLLANASPTPDQTLDPFASAVLANGVYVG